ncbi:serine hydrolase domain-containing protein [Mariniluteicoccus flavus]
MIAPHTRTLLDHRLARAQAEVRVPSLAAGLVRGGELVWEGAVGTLDGRADGTPAAPGVQYRIGSLTKTFVGVLVLRLRDEGLLDLDDRFGEHVPGSPIDRVTIAQLLSHTAGVRAETDGPWWERTPGGDWDALAPTVTQRFGAGVRHHYSNVGYAALGRLVEVHRGAAWHEVLAGELLQPLGMADTTTRPRPGAAPGLAVHPFADVLLAEPEHDAGAMAPAGQLWSTVADIGRWAAFLAGDTAGLLSPETLAEMLHPRVVVDSPGQPWASGHGLGWQIWNEDGRRIAGHGGSMPGFLAGLQVDLATGDGVVIFTNSTTGKIGPVATELLDLLSAHEPHPVAPWSASGSVDDLELVGTWHWGPSVTTGTLRGEHFVLGDPGTGRGARFRRTGPDAWEGLDGYYCGEPLQVVRRPDDTVSHLDVASFRFTRTPYDPAADVPGGVMDWE